MTTHKSRLSITNDWRHSKAGGFSTPVDNQKYQLTVSYADGDGNNQAEDMFRVRASVSANEEDSYDVAGGIVDVFGDALTFATIKEMTIVNRATVAGDDLIRGGGSMPTGGALMTALFDGDATSGLRIKAGGFVVVCAPLTGYAVTGGSADVIRIHNDGTNAVEYDLILKGTRV